MSKREKFLMAVISLLLVGLAVAYVGSSVQKAFRKRRTDKLAAQDKLDQQDLRILRGDNAVPEIHSYEDRSLPSNIDTASSQYDSWLNNLVTSAFGETKGEGEKFKRIEKSNPIRKGDEPVTLSWAVTAEGRLDQITDMLYEYYSLDTLHRITSLKITSKPKSKMLNLTFKTQVLILANIPDTQKLDSSRKSAWAQTHSPEDVMAIVQRNMLSPANKPPELARLSSQKVELGKSLDLQVKGSDPDENDQLSYFLLQPVEGASIDPKSGKIKWKPTEVGDYMFVAQVEDDGIPARTDTREFKVTVAPKPPPPPKPDPPAPKPAPPKVDEAMFTYVTGRVGVNGTPQIWLKVRTTGKTLRLKEGDSIKVGSIDGVVSKIGVRSFELTVGDTKREIKKGQPLVAPKPKPTKPAETATADTE